MNNDGCFTLAGACPLGGGWELAAGTAGGQDHSSPFLGFSSHHSQFACTQGQGGGTAMIFSWDCECSTEGAKV